MENNIWKTNGSTIIINGGNPLPGCPESWVVAKQWQSEANKGKGEDFEPRWKFDCGFKLDFDGPLISISSRFYPPKTDSGDTWDGTVTVYLLGTEVKEKKFDCATLDILKKEVEDFVRNLAAIIKLS